ncbi:MAG: Protoheme IX farnesyltransferase, mitochondrial [Thelocarpon superellum]|nr:MAG: Protoheme IX farnesyltransferase, mitochondrial [Thelocarpon superellum]
MITRAKPQSLLSRQSGESICVRCLLRLSRPQGRVLPRQFSGSSRRGTNVVTGGPTRRELFRQEYFLANESLQPTISAARRGFPGPWAAGADGRRANVTTVDAQASSPLSGSNEELSARLRQTPVDELPHRRKQRLRQESLVKDAAASPTTGDTAMPLDASSRLTTISAALPDRSLRRLLTTYLSLSKPRLSVLIVLTATSAYSLFPVPALLLPTTTASPSLSTLTLLFLTTGTALSTASANALNMLFERSSDAKMSRTRNRPLVRKLISPGGALAFAIATGVAGLGALYYGVNPTVAFLGGLNIVLYAGVYTPMKRLSTLNTWVGAAVGAIPPLMGWAAAAGQSASSRGDWQELLFGSGSGGGWLLAGLLFAWQFPHFNALSWTIRDDYRKAGLQMMAWVNPRRNGRVALRYSILCVPLCMGLWYVGVTDAGFLVTSSLANAWLVREAWRFWRREGQAGSARRLFWASVWHLPLLLVLAMAQKQGLWAGLWRRVAGEEADADADVGEEGALDVDAMQGDAPVRVPVAR